MDAAMNAAFLYKEGSTAAIFNGNSAFMRKWRAAERSGFEHAAHGKYAQFLVYVDFRDDEDDNDMYTGVE